MTTIIYNNNFTDADITNNKLVMMLKIRAIIRSKSCIMSVTFEIRYFKCDFVIVVLQIFKYRFLY